jgi:hypothetical protein
MLAIRSLAELSKHFESSMLLNGGCKEESSPDCAC